MPDLPESGQMPHRIHHVVRCLSFGFIDYQGAIKWRRLRLFWHGFRRYRSEIRRRFILLHVSQQLLDASVLEKLASERVGRFQQTPPAFSAKKVKGRPAYELARKKQPVELKSVEVELFEYKLSEVKGSVARFVIECSSGTYIRSLAHEMGQKLGCGAHLAEIERTAVGEFSLEQAVKLEELAEGGRAGKFADYLIRLENLLPNFPKVNVLPIIERRVRHGTKFNVTLAQVQPGRAEPVPGATTELDGGEPRPPRLRVFSQQNSLIAIAEAVVPRTYQPIVVFEPLP